MHSDHSDKKRTPEFVREIEAMIDNDPRKSISSIARDKAEKAKITVIYSQDII